MYSKAISPGLLQIGVGSATPFETDPYTQARVELFLVDYKSHHESAKRRKHEAQKPPDL
jgi:hypothetical protein